MRFLALGALLLVFALAACGGDDDADQVTATAVSVGATATATAPAATGTSPAATGTSPAATATPVSSAPTATAPSGAGDSTPPPDSVPEFVIESAAFGDGEAIPIRFSCEGENLSPPLAWGGTPPGTEEFALVVNDIDAPGGSFIHWVLYAIPGEIDSLAEGVEMGSSGTNSWDELGWTGPCPPPGSGPHRYVFTVYALRGSLRFVTTPTAAQVVGAIEEITLAQADLIGTYER